MAWGLLEGNTGLAADDLFVQMKEYASDPVFWGKVFFFLVKVVIVIAAGKIIRTVANKALTHMMIEREQSPLKFDQRRTKTIGKLLSNVVNYTVNFIVILLVLNQLGINLGPVLAGAGVLGLAIGFGAQSLVKDVITGFFIIFEDQFGVGDVIQVGTFKGTVEEIGLRVTRIRAWTGEVQIIPNGTIQQLTNFSVHNSMAVVDLAIAYEEDIDRTIEVLKKATEEWYPTQENMLKPPEILGVQSIGNSEVVIRTIAECKPTTQFPIEREMKKLLKATLESNGIELPYPKLVSYIKNPKAE